MPAGKSAASPSGFTPLHRAMGKTVGLSYFYLCILAPLFTANRRHHGCPPKDRSRGGILVCYRVWQAVFLPSKKFCILRATTGLDGIKRKSPSVDEPWHYVDPTRPDDTELITMILDHHHNLVEALQSGNQPRVAFEAAWLAHAIVDGLTPAHHYPLGDKIEELWGKPKDERLTIREKNVIKGKKSPRHH